MSLDWSATLSIELNLELLRSSSTRRADCRQLAGRQVSLNMCACMCIRMYTHTYIRITVHLRGGRGDCVGGTTSRKVVQNSGEYFGAIQP